jgi:5-methylcytosine-specific restriction protein A
MIDKNKIVFITLDWMKYYRGITSDDLPLGTGGSYPADSKHEIYNFLDDGGYCYGYTPASGRINLQSINKDATKKTSDGKEYIENVLVVFTASKNDGLKRRVVGFYVDATVFKEPFTNTNPKRIIKSTKTFASYNIRVKSENVYLFDEENERNIYLPFSKRDGYGYGQSNIWYANDKKSKTIEFRKNIISTIKLIIENAKFEIENNDEEKYLEGKNNTKVKEVISLSRNREARSKCLEHYFPDNKNYKCMICDFNFEKQYGSLGENYIEVHHIESYTTKSKKVGVHSINPITDLIPICSNCHSMIHRKNPELSIDTIRKHIKKQ